MTLSIYGPLTSGPIGPGYTVSIHTTTGPTAVDDLWIVQVRDLSIVHNFFCSGSSRARGYTDGAVTLGIHEWPEGGSGVLDFNLSPGDDVLLQVYLVHTDGFTEVDPQVNVTGFTWDPINAMFQLVSDRGRSGFGFGYNGGALARIEAAVIREFTP